MALLASPNMQPRMQHTHMQPMQRAFWVSAVSWCGLHVMSLLGLNSAPTWHAANPLGLSPVLMWHAVSLLVLSSGLV